MGWKISDPDRAVMEGRRWRATMADPLRRGSMGCRISGATTPPTRCAPQQQQTQAGNNNEKIRKGKSANRSATKSWSLSDPEMQRKKRVASYKVYTMEGKLKGSLRKSFWRIGCAEERREGGSRVKREGTKGWVGERRD